MRNEFRAPEEIAPCMVTDKETTNDTDSNRLILILRRGEVLARSHVTRSLPVVGLSNLPACGGVFGSGNAGNISKRAPQLVCGERVFVAVHGRTQGNGKIRTHFLCSLRSLLLEKCLPSLFWTGGNRGNEGFFPPRRFPSLGKEIFWSSELRKTWAGARNLFRILSR